MPVETQRTLHFEQLTPGSLTTVVTAKAREVLRAKRHWIKSVWVYSVGQNVTVDVLARLDELETSFGTDGYVPLQAASGGAAQADKLFGFNVDGDTLDDLRVQITTGGVAPTAVYVWVKGGQGLI